MDLENLDLNIKKNLDGFRLKLRIQEFFFIKKLVIVGKNL